MYIHIYIKTMGDKTTSTVALICLFAGNSKIDLKVMKGLIHFDWPLMGGEV